MRSRAVIAVAALALAGCAAVTSGTPVAQPVTGQGIGVQVKADQAIAVATQAPFVQVVKPVTVTGTAVGRGTAAPLPLGPSPQPVVEPMQPAPHSSCPPSKGIACTTP